MSHLKINVPPLPESVVSGVIAAINVEVGTAVKIGDVVVELETDKVLLEIPSNHDGVISEIFLKVGDEVTQNQEILSIDTSPEPTSTTNQKAESPAIEQKSHDSLKSSPSARKAASNNDIDLSKIEGSGKDGRVMKNDLKEQLDSATKPQEDIPPVLSDDTATFERVPMTRMRATIAKRLVQSKNDMAMLTTFNDVNMSAIVNARSKYKDVFQKKYGIKLGLTSFFVHAVTAAMKSYPIINTSVDGQDILYHKSCHLGIAVSTEKGLVVPVIRNAESKSMLQIETEVLEYANKARQQKITMEDLQGGTFTITNGGVFGSLLSTPIVNPPQTAILGLHRIEKRVIVVGDKTEICPMMYIALSYDHRVIDGRDSVGFLKLVKDTLEDPARMLLNV